MNHFIPLKRKTTVKVTLPLFNILNNNLLNKKIILILYSQKFSNKLFERF